jgi:HK97 family phage prohead protease
MEKKAKTPTTSEGDGHVHTFTDHDSHFPPMEVKQLGGHVVDRKEVTRDTPAGPVRLGVIEVLIATWDIDTGGKYGIPDRFERGAFAESIEEHRSRDRRQVRLKDQHGRTMGGFPIETVSETEAGLFAVGEINLGRQDGRESWELIKQGVLVDMSVGFSALRDDIVEGVRVISKATLWEGSVVDEPANRGATILGFKSTPFVDLPIAPIDHPWDEVAARSRVDGYVDLGGFELKSAFVQEKNATDEAFDLQIADVVDGKLTAVPAALKKAADQLLDRDGTSELVEHLERYFAKMGVPSPFPDHQRKFYAAAEVREWKAADVERALASGVRFSKGAAKVLASRLTKGDGPRYDAKAIGRILHNLEQAKRELTESK